jgi:ubiquitin-like protein Pup
MAEREQKRKSAPARETEEVVDAPATSETGEKLKADIDDLLDEIDEVLRAKGRGVTFRHSFAGAHSVPRT